MQKILVIGCPGSGKSTFAKELAKAMGLPLVHLDMLYWNSDGNRVEREVFLERLDQTLVGDSWIIDGNYISTMDMRMNLCDTVFFLDYDVAVCLDGIASRVGTKRSDIPWVETTLDAEFAQYVENFQNETRPTVLEILEKHKDKKIFAFTNRDQAREFLGRLVKGE